MGRRRVLALVAAVGGLFVIGATGTWSIRALLSGGDAVSVATTTTTLPIWVRGGELVVGPAIVVPQQVAVSGDLVTVSYQTVAITGAVLPERWTLLTTGGEIPADQEASVNRVVFTMTPGTTAADITGVRLDRYWLASPIDAEISLDPADDGPHEVAPGVFIALVTVAPQSTGAVIAVEIGGGPWGGSILGRSDLGIDGVGPGWASASSNFGNRLRWTLNYYGDGVPESIGLRVWGTLWVPLPSGAVSHLEGVPRV